KAIHPLSHLLHPLKLAEFLIQSLPSIDLADLRGMASSLPNELICQIAEYLIEPDQYVVIRRTERCNGMWKLELENKKFAALLKRRFPLTKPQTSPLALALFSPSLLAEYVKLLHKRAIFYFHDSSCLYDYINPPGAIKNFVLGMRRNMRFVRMVELEGHSCCTCAPLAPRYSLPVACHMHSSSRTSLYHAMLLLPKIETVHVDHLLGFEARTSARPMLFRKERSRYIDNRLVRDLWPLFERTKDLGKALGFGCGDFGRLCNTRTGFFAPNEYDRDEHTERLHRMIDAIKREEMHLVRKPSVN
ncbi:hypothetical protein IWX46DRAFT_661608, partial [Phyllosticta citricarpa]